MSEAQVLPGGSGPVTSIVQSRAPAGRFYCPELDALRFFAFFCVLLHHYPLPQNHRVSATVGAAGEFGLPMFFLLSAFLIVTLLLREHDRTGTVSIRAFAMRRVLRIWPLYFLGIAIGIVYGILWPQTRITWGGILAMLLFVGNVYAVHASRLLGVMTHLWSISVEEQFYLSVPWLGRFGARSGLWCACILTLAVSYAALAFLASRRADYGFHIWWNSLIQFQFFAIGGILALVFDRRQNELSLMQRGLLFLGGLASWYCVASKLHLAVNHAASLMPAILGYSFILAGTSAVFLSFLHVKLAIPAPVIYLGKISYGLYVFHLLFINLVIFHSPLARSGIPHSWVLGLITTMVLTIATASVSYRFFEKPILRLKGRFEVIRTREA